MNQAIAAYSAWLPPRGVAELFASGVPTIAGALHPPAKAVRTDGGWRITGQVPFASGCHHVQWLVMPAQEQGADTPFGVFFPREAATLLAVRFVNDVVGASSIRIGQPFERHFRDAHTLLQHSDKSSPRYASAGRLMFGLENDWVWLSF
jgi:hypothetical protein